MGLGSCEKRSEDNEQPLSMEGCLAQVLVERQTCWHNGISLFVRLWPDAVDYFDFIKLMIEHKKTVYRVRLKAVYASNSNCRIDNIIAQPQKSTESLVGICCNNSGHFSHIIAQKARQLHGITRRHLPQ